MRRIGSFLPSVLPDERKQLLLLVGACFLELSEALRWWPDYHPMQIDAASLRMPSFLGVALDHWIYFTKVSSFFIFCAGAVAYFVCFWPGQRPTRRLFYGSVLPGALGILAVCIRSLILASHQATLLKLAPKLESSTLDVGFHSVSRLLWDLGPGLRFAVVGLLLVSFAAIQIRRGKLHFPLQITPAISSAPSPSCFLVDGLTRVQSFIWFCLALLPVATSLFVLPVFIPLLLRSLHHGSSFWDPIALSPSMYILQSFLESLPLLLTALWAIAGGRRDVLKQALRIPSRKYFALAILFPVMACLLPRTCASLAEGSDIFSPWPYSFFGLPMKSEFLFFFLLPLFAEIAWRGYLQPQLVSRYGVFRALFLVGVIWGVAYFGVFPSMIWADAGVLLRLTGGIIWGLGYSFVFGWLTIRSGSVLPAAVAAGLADILLRATLYDAYAVLRPETVRAAGVAIWCVIAVVLFRYWPVKENEPQSNPTEVPQS